MVQKHLLLWTTCLGCPRCLVVLLNHSELSKEEQKYFGKVNYFLLISKPYTIINQLSLLLSLL
jgi:hypothetical protein